MLKKFLLLFCLLNTGPALAAGTAGVSMATVETLLEQGKVSDAISHLQQLLQHRPKHYQAWFLLGVNQAGTRQFHDAIVSFRQVIALQPDLAEPHNNLAVIYNELGDYRAAVAALEASLKLKPDYATAHENIGDLYIKLAADAYKQALDKNNDADLRQRYRRLLHVRVAETVETIEAIDVVESAERSNTDISTNLIVQKPPVPAPQVRPATVPGTAQKIEQKTAVEIPASTTEGSSVEPKSELRQEQQYVGTTAQKTDLKLRNETVLAAVEAWRAAWSKRNLAAYFAAYSEAYDFGDRFVSMRKWKDYKHWAITKRTFIKVTLENIVTTGMAANVVKVSFLQHFRSDSFNSDDSKEMLLRKTTNGWKIIYEASK